MITIDGQKYHVIEDLGYTPSAGCYAKVVQYNGKERIAIRLVGSRNWRWQSLEDKLKPKSQYIGQKY